MKNSDRPSRSEVADTGGSFTNERSARFFPQLRVLAYSY